MSNWTFNSQNIDLEAVTLSFENNGFVIVKNMFNNSEIQAMLDDAEAICTGGKGDILGSDSIEVGSGVNASILSKIIAIHFPHKVSEKIKSIMVDDRIAQVLAALIGKDVKCMQSMLFVKGPGKPGQAWHQDEQFIPTRDKSLCGVWVALDDARIDNGALWMHPGSHKPGVLWQSVAQNDDRFDATNEAIGYPFEREGGVPVEINAGDVAFFHGYTLHRSLNNTRKQGFRRSLVYHYMSANSLLPWSIENPPVPRTDYRDIVMVCGQDPYAWKGIEALSIPYIRPENQKEAKTVFSQLEQTCS